MIQLWRQRYLALAELFSAAVKSMVGCRGLQQPA
jgi:hypothetical protein